MCLQVRKVKPKNAMIFPKSLSQLMVKPGYCLGLWLPEGFPLTDLPAPAANNLVLES